MEENKQAEHRADAAFEAADEAMEELRRAADKAAGLLSSQVMLLCRLADECSDRAAELRKRPREDEDEDEDDPVQVLASAMDAAERVAMAHGYVVACLARLEPLTKTDSMTGALKRKPKRRRLK